MSQVTYEEVNLMLKLYEMRREPRLRQARAWFLEHFHPTSPEDMIQKFPQGGEENTFIRMVIQLLGYGGEHREPGFDQR